MLVTRQFYKYILALLGFTFLMASCALVGKRHEQFDYVPLESVAVSNEDSIEFPEPKDIAFDIKRLRSLDFGKDTLNRNAVLEQVFNKQIDPDDWNYNDFYDLTYWKCSTCKKVSILDENQSYADQLVYEKLPLEINYTQLIGQLDFQGSNEKAYSLLSFSTGPDYELTGRFVSGMLSLALMEKNDSWKIKQFNLVVNYQGAFQQANGIDTLIELPNGEPLFVGYGGVANGVSAEDYWPVYENLYCYDFKDLKETIKFHSAVCWINGDEDLGSKWETKIIEPQMVGEQTQLTVLTTGRLDKDRMWGLPEGLTQDVYNQLPQVSNFELKTIYGFVDGKWTKIKIVVESWTDSTNKRQTYVIL